jgi:hypothetical protein
MAGLAGTLVLSYLLAVVFTDEISLDFSYIDRIVTYEQNVDFTELIPGELYNGTITASWAVLPAALEGLDAQTLSVRITATAPENSSVFFPVGDMQSKETTVYLQCKLQSGSCAEGSVLSVDIPVAATALPETGHKATIIMRSEIVGSMPQSYESVQQEAGAVFESLKKVFSQNLSGSAAAAEPVSSVGGEAALPAASDVQSQGALNFSFGALGNGEQAGNGNFLDSLKPEGDSQDPLLFLRENPLVSIFALIIVIVITGAYLLNAKD